MAATHELCDLIEKTNVSKKSSDEFEPWPGRMTKFVVRQDGEIISYGVNVKATIENNFSEKYRLCFDVGDSVWFIHLNDDFDDMQRTDGFVSIMLELKAAHTRTLPITVNYCFEYGSSDIVTQSNCKANLFSVPSKLSNFGYINWKKIQNEPINVNFFMTFNSPNKSFIIDHQDKPKFSSNGIFLSCLPPISVGETDVLFLQRGDIELKGENYNYFAHRQILEKVSSGFAEIVNKTGNSNEIRIEGLSAEAAKSLLRFIYTGELDVNDLRVIIELWSMSHEYRIDSLKIACDILLSSNITKENAIKKMKEAMDHQLPLSVIKVSDFIKKHFKQIVETKEWEELCNHPPSIIFITKKLKS